MNCTKRLNRWCFVDVGNGYYSMADSGDMKTVMERVKEIAILGQVKLALKRTGADKEYIDQHLSEATSGDYESFAGGTAP